MNKVELIATTAFGLESIVAYEFKKLGYTDLKGKQRQYNL